MNLRSLRLGRCLPLAILSISALFASGGFATCGAAEKTPYRVLQVDACPEMHPAPATPYAYGWFGVTPRAHATRHFGYYKTYTEWSWR